VLAEKMRLSCLFVQKEKGLHGLNSYECEEFNSCEEFEGECCSKEGIATKLCSWGFSTLVFFKHVLASCLF